MTDYTYKTDIQLIMLALLRLAKHHEDLALAEEMLQRTKEQRQRIPLQVRCNHEKTELTKDTIKIGGCWGMF